jgi:pyruvate formate lyase activating enzyme
MAHEAKFYKKEAGNKTKCLLCPHGCLILPGKRGICGARFNGDGVLYSTVYGEITSYGMDPIEKKPLYNFYPGSRIFSIGSWGCTFKCEFCQNWQISQQEAAAEHFEKEDVIKAAMENNSMGVAYTYNEPFAAYEFMFDTAVLARKSGLKNVVVTNGFVSQEPLKEILPYVDAMNIDLKSFSDAFYRETCAGRLEPVLRAIRQAFDAGTHIELTTLIIPGMNDGEDLLKIVDWIYEISPDIPLHLSRYFPQYKMGLDPTGIETMKRAYSKAREKLRYVYLGNVAAETGGSDTFCPACGKKIIKREIFNVDVSALKGGKCSHCGDTIYGKF